MLKSKCFFSNYFCVPNRSNNYLRIRNRSQNQQPPQPQPSSSSFVVELTPEEEEEIILSYIQKRHQQQKEKQRQKQQQQPDHPVSDAIVVNDGDDLRHPNDIPRWITITATDEIQSQMTRLMNSKFRIVWSGISCNDILIAESISAAAPAVSWTNGNKKNQLLPFTMLSGSISETSSKGFFSSSTIQKVRCKLMNLKHHHSNNDHHRIGWNFVTYAVKDESRTIHGVKFHIYEKVVPPSYYPPGTLVTIVNTTEDDGKATKKRYSWYNSTTSKSNNTQSAMVVEYHETSNMYLIQLVDGDSNIPSSSAGSLSSSLPPKVDDDEEQQEVDDEDSVDADDDNNNSNDTNRTNDDGKGSDDTNVHADDGVVCDSGNSSYRTGSRMRMIPAKNLMLDLQQQQQQDDSIAAPNNKEQIRVWTFGALYIQQQPPKYGDDCMTTKSYNNNDCMDTDTYYDETMMNHMENEMDHNNGKKIVCSYLEKIICMIYRTQFLRNVDSNEKSMAATKNQQRPKQQFDVKHRACQEYWGPILQSQMLLYNNDNAPSSSANAVWQKIIAASTSSSSLSDITTTKRTTSSIKSPTGCSISSSINIDDDDDDSKNNYNNLFEYTNYYVEENRKIMQSLLSGVGKETSAEKTSAVSARTVEHSKQQRFSAIVVSEEVEKENVFDVDSNKSTTATMKGEQQQTMINTHIMKQNVTSTAEESVLSTTTWTGCFTKISTRCHNKLNLVASSEHPTLPDVSTTSMEEEEEETSSYESVP